MTKREMIDFCEMKSQLEPENEDIFRHMIKALEQETVSRETYESEYLGRKQAEYELWKIKEQQPSEDCVSRQAVFETIDDCNSDGLKGIFCSYDDGERFKKCIKNLPPVLPTPKWNTTPPTSNTSTILLSAETESEGPHVWIGCYVDGHYYYDDGIIDVDDEIVAWMPLPEAYKTEREAEDA